MADVRKIYDVVIKIYDLSIDAFFKEDLTVSQKAEIQGLIKETQDMITKALDDHVVRLRKGICHTAQGVIFTKLLQDLDRTGDHSYNIAKLAKKDTELISQL
jgi:phosphate:Na+ symporter